MNIVETFYTEGNICSFQVEPDQGALGDDTGLNGMRLDCRPRVYDEDHYYGVIEAYRYAQVQYKDQ